MTKILLVVSIVFLLTNSPSHIVRVYLFVMQLDVDYKPGYPIFIVQNMLQYLFYANFAAKSVKIGMIRDQNRLIGLQHITKTLANRNQSLLLV